MSYIYKNYVKRFLDILISILVLFFGFPFFLFISLLIKLDSPGPVLFKQKRVGHNKKIFVLYKFRTMVKDADKMKKKLLKQNVAAFPAFKIQDDPRLTRIGKILRKTHMDELPNFINVLKGDMSIIGFRPPTLDEIKYYKKHHFERFKGKPGITSMWAVMYYHASSFDDWINSDVFYERNCSFTLDFMIAVKTIQIIIKGIFN